MTYGSAALVSQAVLTNFYTSARPVAACSGHLQACGSRRTRRSSTAERPGHASDVPALHARTGVVACQLQKIPSQFVPAHWGIGNGTVALFLLRVQRLEFMFNVMPLRILLYFITPLIAHKFVIAAFALYYAETGWAVFVESGTCFFALLAFVYLLDNVGFERCMQVLRSFFFVFFVTVHVCFNAPHLWIRTLQSLQYCCKELNAGGGGGGSRRQQLEAAQVTAIAP